MEHKKQDTVNALRKATDIHDQAVFNFHNAQSDLQVGSPKFPDDHDLN